MYNTLYYSDESKTGRINPETGIINPDFRRWYRKAIVAAKVEDDDFSWLSKFKRDFGRGELEIKSNRIYDIIKNNTNAKELFLSQISRYSILIIDFYEHYDMLINSIQSILPNADKQHFLEYLNGNNGNQSFENIFNRLFRLDNPETIKLTIVPIVESMLNSIINSVQPELLDRDKIFNKNILHEMSDQEVKELIVRFSVAFADMLKPELQVDLLNEHLQHTRYFNSGYFSFCVINNQLSDNIIYHRGNNAAFSKLEEAHEKMARIIEQSSYSMLEKNIHGSFRQEESKNYLGIQSADLAAGYATILYENGNQDRVDSAKKLKSIFKEVLFNSNWL